MVIWHLTSLINFSAISLFLPSITHNLTMLSTVTGASDNFLIFWTALLYYSRTIIVLVVVPRVSTAPRALTDAQPKMCGRSQAFPLKMMTMIISVIIIVRWWNHRQRIHKNLPACRIKKHLFAKCSQNVETHSFPTMCTTGGSKWIKAKIFSKAAKK